jgi:hypothetical protein
MDYPRGIGWIACPRLIMRFMNKDPKFLFLRAPRVLARAAETGAGFVEIPYSVSPFPRFPPASMPPLARASSRAVFFGIDATCLHLMVLPHPTECRTLCHRERELHCRRLTG